MLCLRLLKLCMVIILANINLSQFDMAWVPKDLGCHQRLAISTPGTLLPALCCRENVTQVLSIEGKWYTTIHPLSQRKYHASTIAFCQGKMIHCHLPFVTEIFLSSKNTCPLSKRKCFASTMPFSQQENSLWLWLLFTQWKSYVDMRKEMSGYNVSFLTGKMVCENVSFV